MNLQSTHRPVNYRSNSSSHEQLIMENLIQQWSSAERKLLTLIHNGYVPASNMTAAGSWILFNLEHQYLLVSAKRLNAFDPEAHRYLFVLPKSNHSVGQISSWLAVEIKGCIIWSTPSRSLGFYDFKLDIVMNKYVCHWVHLHRFRPLWLNIIKSKALKIQHHFISSIGCVLIVNPASECSWISCYGDS